VSGNLSGSSYLASENLAEFENLPFFSLKISSDLNASHFWENLARCIDSNYDFMMFCNFT